MPCRSSSRTPSGVIATRCSRVLISLGTPTVRITAMYPSFRRDDRGCQGELWQDHPMAQESSAIDRLDREILGALRVDARISWRELGERVHLSATSVADRVRRMERDGIIEGYTVRVDPEALGRTVRAVVDVSLGT